MEGSLWSVRTNRRQLKIKIKNKEGRPLIFTKSMIQIAIDVIDGAFYKLFLR